MCAQSTYHRDGSDDLLGRYKVGHDHLVDEVGGQAKDDDQGDDLHYADHKEGCAQWWSAVAWDRHVDDFVLAASYR